MRQLNRRFVSDRSFSDLTKLPPSDFGRPIPDYCLTVLPIVPSDCCLNNDRTRPSDHAVIARLSPPSATAWPLARLLLSGICSIVCRRPSVHPCTCLALAVLVAVRRPLHQSPVLSASPVDRPFTGTWSLLRFSPRRSCDRLFIVPTVSRQHQRQPSRHVLSYENGGCQFTEPYLYEICSSVPSTKCHGRN